MSYICPNNPNKLTGTFLGYGMSQNPEALWLWEQVLRVQNFKRFIDIGTWKGGLSMYFYLWCLDREADFYSYDIREKCYPRKGKKLFEKLGFYKHFYLKDVFEAEEEIGNLIGQSGKTIIFCDNGQKEKEFQTFSPYLKSGDIIAVHDWMTETRPEVIYPIADFHNLKEIFIEESQKEKMTRFFQKL